MFLWAVAIQECKISTDIEQLREDIYNLQPEPQYPTEEFDVCEWTNNGLGNYARSDIDIFVCASTVEEGNRKVRDIYRKIRALEGEECVSVKTPNSVTICRSWPERHVQVVLLTMPSISETLLFCDLDCTCLAFKAGRVFTNSRSRRAIATRKNVVPHSMLLNRSDTPKRVAAYTRRGFSPHYLTDSRVRNGVLAPLLQKVEEERNRVPKKLLDLMVFDLDGAEIDMQEIVGYLVALCLEG